MLSLWRSRISSNAGGGVSPTTSSVLPTERNQSWAREHHSARDSATSSSQPLCGTRISQIACSPPRTRGTSWRTAWIMRLGDIAGRSNRVRCPGPRSSGIALTRSREAPAAFTSKARAEAGRLISNCVHNRSAVSGDSQASQYRPPVRISACLSGRPGNTGVDECNSHLHEGIGLQSIQSGAFAKQCTPYTPRSCRGCWGLKIERACSKDFRPIFSSRKTFARQQEKS
ncbi:hypothetical protein D3C81_517100 [compost metagenome]